MTRPWPTIRLGELAEFRNGLNYTDADQGNGLAVIGVSDFKDLVTAPLDRLQELDLKALPRSDALVRKGDIVFVRSNGNRELIGRSLFVDRQPEKPTSHSGFTIRCRFLDNRCYPRFYAYLFRGPLIRQILSAAGGGTTISNLNQGILASLDVPLPPIDVQQRIASILSAYDDLIENNTRRIAILEEMARRLYEEWFVKFRFPGHEAALFKDDKDGRLPAGWRRVPLKEMYETSSGGTPSRKSPEYYGDEHFWVKTKELCDGPIYETEERISASGLENSSAKLFPPHSVIVAMYGATIGQLGVLMTEAATNQACCALLPSQGPHGWAYAFLTMLQRRNDLIDLRSGAAQQNISQAIIKDFAIVKADQETHRHFEKAVAPIVGLAFTLHRKNAKLRAQRDLLLPKLISGEIDVSQVAEPEADAA